MPRRRLCGSAGLVFHVLNRAACQRTIFDNATAYLAFVSLLAEARRRVPIRLLTYCVMPTHFHLVVWPNDDTHLPSFMQWLTGTHAQRWRAQRGTSGCGAVYQGRYKALPIQTGGHMLRVCRYVERNPLRAGLVASAETWRWAGLWQRRFTTVDIELDERPVAPPANWVEYVNRPENERELLAIRTCLARRRPIGEPGWRGVVRERFGLSERGRGRPPGLSQPVVAAQPVSTLSDLPRSEE